jgi:hypothetical protein
VRFAADSVNAEITFRGGNTGTQLNFDFASSNGGRLATFGNNALINGGPISGFNVDAMN